MAGGEGWLEHPAAIPALRQLDPTSPPPQHMPPSCACTSADFCCREPVASGAGCSAAYRVERGARYATGMQPWEPASQRLYWKLRSLRGSFDPSTPADTGAGVVFGVIDGRATIWTGVRSASTSTRFDSILDHASG